MGTPNRRIIAQCFFLMILVQQSIAQPANREDNETNSPETLANSSPSVVEEDTSDISEPPSTEEANSLDVIPLDTNAVGAPEDEEEEADETINENIPVSKDEDNSLPDSDTGISPEEDNTVTEEEPIVSEPSDEVPDDEDNPNPVEPDTEVDQSKSEPEPEPDVPVNIHGTIRISAHYGPKPNGQTITEPVTGNTPRSFYNPQTYNSFYPNCYNDYYSLQFCQNFYNYFRNLWNYCGCCCSNNYFNTPYNYLYPNQYNFGGIGTAYGNVDICRRF